MAETDLTTDEGKLAMLMAKISTAANDVDYIQKAGHNKQQGYKFVGASDAFPRIREAFQKQGIWVEVSHVVTHQAQVEIGRNGSRQQWVAVEGCYTYCDLETGYTRTVTSPGEGMDAGDKATYKALTACTRHHLLTFLLISTGDDPEADESIDKLIATENAEAAAEEWQRFEIPMGKNKGRLLPEVLAEDPGWVEWAATKANNADERPIYQAALDSLKVAAGG